MTDTHALPDTYRKRTPEEMARNQERRSIPPNTPPTPAIVTLLGNPERIEQLGKAADAMAQDDASVTFLRLLLLESGLPCPQATKVAEFVYRAVQLGWQPVPTCLAQPLPGSLFVETDEQGEPDMVGVVAKVHKEGEETQRDWFLGTVAPDRPAKWEVGRVSFWLLAPGGCKPCAARKRMG